MKLLISEFNKQENFHDVSCPYALQIANAIVDEINEVAPPAGVDLNELTTKLYDIMVKEITKEKLIELIPQTYDIGDTSPEEYIYHAEDAVTDYISQITKASLENLGYKKVHKKSPPATTTKKNDIPITEEDASFLVGDIVVISDLKEAKDLPKDLFYVILNIQNENLLRIAGVYSRQISPTFQPDPETICIERYVVPSRLKIYPATIEDYDDFAEYLNSLTIKTRIIESSLDALKVGRVFAYQTESASKLNNAAFLIPISDKCPIDCIRIDNGFVGLVTQTVVTRSDNKMNVMGIYADDTKNLNLMKNVTKKRLVDLSYFYYYKPSDEDLKEYRTYLKSATHMRYNSLDIEEALTIIEALLEKKEK